MSFKYWDNCADAEDMEDMWKDLRVSDEWISVEAKGRKVHLFRDPDGQVFLTKTEMKDMICAISEIGSSKQPLAESYDRKTKNVSIGLMRILPATAEWGVFYFSV